MEAIIQSCLCTNVQQHIVLVNPNQGRSHLAIRSKGRSTERSLEKVESGHQPLDCLVSIARAMYRDSWDT